MKTRTAEFVLGLIGGILGIILSVLVLLLGGALASLGLGDMVDALGGAVMIYGILVLVASIVGIVASVIVKKNGILGGILMIIAAVGGFLCISWLYIVSAVLFLIAGLLGVFRKVDAAQNTIAK